MLYQWRLPLPVFLCFILSPLISQELLLCHCSLPEHPRYFLAKKSPKDSRFLSVSTISAESSCPGCWCFTRAQLSRAVFPPELQKVNVAPGCPLAFQEEYGCCASAGLIFDITACCYVMCPDVLMHPKGMSTLMLGASPQVPALLLLPVHVPLAIQSPHHQGEQPPPAACSLLARSRGSRAHGGAAAWLKATCPWLEGLQAHPGLL